MLGDSTMMRAAIAFFVVALIAMILGFSGVASFAVNIGWLLLIVAVVLLIISMISGRRVP